MAILTAVMVTGFLLFLLWCLTGLLLYPVSAGGMVTIWRISGRIPDLERRVRYCLWLQRTGLLQSTVLLVDCGLMPEARRRAEILTRNEPKLHLISECDLTTYFELVKADNGTEL